ncbi:MAG: ferritin-like domain-containing protein [Rhodobacteraceae bacterium]|nr:ferritin-like domain-containing protein [Paracoccaceae bacterium]
MTEIAGRTPGHHWTLDDIPWDGFDRSKVSAEIVKVIKAAAMVERNGADYGRYLANVFADDPGFRSQAEAWAIEEEQHGLALGRWAALADPDFDFDGAFADFRRMYRIPVEATLSVRGSRTGELCARCVVETGTSSFYSAIRDAVDEPVLKDICKRIAADEFRHYRLFFGQMERYLAREPLSVWRRLKVALERVNEADDDELASAYHAGNRLGGNYDRAKAIGDYQSRALGFYRERHVRRASHMIAQASGLKPDGWLARAVARILWTVISWRGRKFRAALV